MKKNSKKIIFSASFPPIQDEMEDNVIHAGDMNDMTQIPGNTAPGHWLCPELSHLSQPPPDARYGPKMPLEFMLSKYSPLQPTNNYIHS